MVNAHFQKSGPQAAEANAAAVSPAGAALGLKGLDTAATRVAKSAAAIEAAAEVAATEVAAAAGAAAKFPPTAFVCQNFTCQAPTSSPEKVYQLLNDKGGAVKLQPVKL